MPIESVMQANHLILRCPFSSCPQSFPASVFSSESALHIRWPKDWCFSISPSNEYSGLNSSFRIDWFDLPAVQGTLKSILQHHSSEVSIFQHSAFFRVQLSHLYRTTGKTTALTIQAFVSKVMSLLFNMLSRFVIAFLPRSKCLRFKGLDLIDRLPKELWMEVHDIVQEAGIKTISKEKKCKKANVCQGGLMKSWEMKKS